MAARRSITPYASTLTLLFHSDELGLIMNCLRGGPQAKHC